MRHLLAAIAVSALAAAPAAAQPVTRPEVRGECGVTFVRAPDDVRHEIERWLEAEPGCAASIELRVVPTEGGLYLLAQRADGRIHERLVPDAQSAGVLVASWVADDWTEAPPARSRPMTVEVDPFSMGAPGSVGVAAVAPAPAKGGTSHWLSLGVVVDTDQHGGGFRGEAELLALGAWKLGAVLSYSSSSYDLAMDSNFDSGFLDTRDLKAMAYLSRGVNLGRWELRAGIGAGAIRSKAMVFGMTGYQSGSLGAFASYITEQTFPVGEISAMITRRIGYSWGLGIGPVLTMIDETFKSTDPNLQNADASRRLPQLTIFGGLRYEL